MATRPRTGSGTIVIVEGEAAPPSAPAPGTPAERSSGTIVIPDDLLAALAAAKRERSAAFDAPPARATPLVERPRETAAPKRTGAATIGLSEDPAVATRRAPTPFPTPQPRPPSAARREKDVPRAHPFRSTRALDDVTREPAAALPFTPAPVARPVPTSPATTGSGRPARLMRSASGSTLALTDPVEFVPGPPSGLPFAAVAGKAGVALRVHRKDRRTAKARGPSLGAQFLADVDANLGRDLCFDDGGSGPLEASGLRRVR